MRDRGRPCLVYNVLTMSHMKVAEARARFGEILDEAERGQPVVIERRGVHFRIIAEARATLPPATSPFEFVDPAVAGGQWTWRPKKGGLAFARRRRR